MNNYQTHIHCPVTPQQAYRAIAEEMSLWWTPMSATFDAVGDRAKTDFGGEAYWVFEAKKLDSPKLIELECVVSQMLVDELDNPEEWLGTTLRFDISATPTGTEIIFTHHGLTPEMQCYEICHAGWNHYISGSLRDYLSGWGGQPNSY